jgi:8-oxo-dGTP pyrophosphatase MutT (NUDIX family)
MKNLDELEICIPVISAIVERLHNGQIEILIQTRWQPNTDPKYSGTIEIPSGWIFKYETVYDALRREVFEETGLTVIKIKPETRTTIYSIVDDGAFAFMPFCCQQQIKDGLPWIGFVFICEVNDAEPRPQENETKDVRWIKKNRLKEIFKKNPEKIFTFQLGALDLYFKDSI